MSNGKMSRRQFCALGTASAVAAIAGGMGMVNNVKAEETAAKAHAIGDGDVNFSQDVDILIVGAGISGMFASIDPGNAGLNVLIVEQNSTYGGDAI